jgi:hypothetical protein
MRYKTFIVTSEGIDTTQVMIEQAVERFVSFPAEVGNPNYDAFLESQGLSDAEVQAMEPDEWHDLSAT